MARIVIIDDDPAILELMLQVSRRLGHVASAHATGRQGLAAVEAEKPDLLLVDLKIPDWNGLRIIEECRKRHPEMAVVMVTGYGSVETAVEAMKLGAFDYLTKPFDPEDLQRIIAKALERERGISGAGQMPEDGREAAGPGVEFIGESPQIRGMLDLAARVADKDSPVLLEGEFGSGKQMVARALHNMSKRRAAPFKVLHCAGLPGELIEQELFGTGGGRSIFSRAEGGTVVLEEINVLPIRLQSQLDSWLEEHTGRKRQGPLAPGTGFRFLATSSVPLEQLVREARFREDLYYRISVIPITLPPLRNRREDIPLLVSHFLKRYAQSTGSALKEMDRFALQMLSEYGWPGNVGELENALERACTLAEGDRIRPADLPPKISQKVEAAEDEGAKSKTALPVGTRLADFIKKQERAFIRETLRYNQGSREKTAAMLGVSIATLYRKMGLKLERDRMLG